MCKKWLTFLVTPLFFIGCAAVEPLEKREAMYGKGIPEITDSYAAKEIRPGETWLVYLKANHPDRGLKNILGSIIQPGMGEYPSSIIRIRPENSGELDGYIYLSTLKHAWALNMVNLTLTVQIEDKAGHFSKPVSFPLSMNNASKQTPPPKDRFKDYELGPISIEIRVPAGTGR